MRLLVALVVVIGVSLFLALLALEDPGYVILTRAPYTVRLSLALLALILLLSFGLLYLLLNFIAGIGRAPKRLRTWRQQQNIKTAQAQSVLGYADLIEGDWEQAERRLLTRLAHNPASLINYLGAAYAAQQQGELQRRDRYLNDAMQCYPKQRNTVSLTQARLQHQAGQLAECRDTLEQLRQTAPGNIPAVRLLADTYQRLGDWPALVALLPQAKKLGALAEVELQAREKVAYERHLAASELVREDGKQADPEAWKALPMHVRKTPNAVAGYARLLLRSGDMVGAEKLLRTRLNKAWHPDLAYLYGQVETDFPTDQIKLVEAWIKKYPDQPELMLALGRLSRHAQQYDKAQLAFRQAVALGGRNAAVVELAALLAQLGEKDAALMCYKKAMADLPPERESIRPPAASGQLTALEQQVEDPVVPPVSPG